MKHLTAVDLFAGCGGLSKGFMDAGFDVVLGVDFDDAALKTFKENHGSAEAMKLDLFDHRNISKIIDFLEEKNISLDVLIGGPPCQGFSIAGPRNQDDKRNMLYSAMVKLASRIKPRAVVLENVPGMLTTNNGIGAKRIISDFAAIGYKMVPKLLYAPDYGIPQIRRRVFFVGLRDSADSFSFPEPTCAKESYITCFDAISDLPSLQKADGSIIYGEEIQQYSLSAQNDYQRKMRENSNTVRNHIMSIFRVFSMCLRMLCISNYQIIFSNSVPYIERYIRTSHLMIGMSSWNMEQPMVVASGFNETVFPENQHYSLLGTAKHI